MSPLCSPAVVTCYASGENSLSPVRLIVMTLLPSFEHRVWSVGVLADRSLSWMTPISSGVDRGEQSHTRVKELPVDGGGQGERGVR